MIPKQLSERIQIAQTAVDALAVGLGRDLISVVLFGSQARQDAQSNSDWDILVIADNLPDSIFMRRLGLKELLPASHRGDISLLARTPAEFEAQFSSLYLDVALDGRILYDPSGYMTHKLSALRTFIGNVGLYRERTDMGDIWHWRYDPVPNWSSQITTALAK